MTPVPFFDLAAQHRPLAAELAGAFARVLGSNQFILGREVDQFEAALAAATGARHAVALSSGTDAITLALMALDLGPGDEVLCPSFTFFSTAGCVARLGATPVLVDSELDTFNLDVSCAARRITPRTRAIIPVHLFGQPADLGKIAALAREHRLTVIEDAAQAIGASFGGEPIGRVGHATTLSFFPTKNLGALGDAGALLTHDAELAQRVRRLRAHGMEPKYFHREIGGNFRIDAVQAALLAVKLPYLAGYTARRRKNAADYAARLRALPGVALNQDGCAGSGEARLLLPQVAPDRDSIWNQYTIRVLGPGRRDALRAYLTEQGIGSEIYYPVPLHEQECFAALGYQPSDLPRAHQLAQEVLSLPIYPEIGTEKIEQVCHAIARFLASDSFQPPAKACSIGLGAENPSG